MRQSNRPSNLIDLREDDQKERTIWEDIDQLDPWPGEVRLTVTKTQPRNPKHQVIKGFAMLCGGLLMAMTGYAMFKGDRLLLSEVISLVKQGITLVCGWAIGSLSTGKKPRSEHEDSQGP